MTENCSFLKFKKKFHRFVLCQIFSSKMRIFLIHFPAPLPNASPQDELQSVLNSLAHQVESFQTYLTLSKKQRKLVKPEFLNEHQVFLNDIFNRLRVLNVSKPQRNSVLVSSTYYQPQSSTPYRSDYIRKPLAFSIGSQSTDTSEFH